MSVVVVTPPGPLVSLVEAKAHLKVDHGDDDTLIGLYVAAAQGHIDGPDGWLGRAIGLQTLELRTGGFWGWPGYAYRLPFPPVVSITSVKHLDAAGVEQTIAASGYELDHGSLRPIYGGSWPVTRVQSEAVRIRYQAGYAIVPPSIKAAVLLMVGDLHANRESSVQGTISAEIKMSTTVEALLSPFRIYSL